MAAIAAVVQMLETGDRVVATENAYGGTRRLFEGLMARFGLGFDWVDTADLERVSAAVGPRTRMLFVETPTNPTLGLTDLGGAARIAREHGLKLVVDNTFMTPCLQRPIEHGADLVVHSTTKYLNGHSDSLGGAVIAREAADAERIAWIQRSAGAILSPLDSFLVLRGIKTLALRMERHQTSARVIAAWLDRHDGVERVYYPGLDDYPQAALAGRQMKGPGGIVTFDLGRLDRAKRVAERLRVWQLAESLGGVESLVSHPATMTHAWLDAAERRRIGVGDGLLRLSVGVEDVDDLVEDLDQALAGEG
jgi:cystathionine beta-lyase/cystathionine gamma-synthase